VPSDASSDDGLRIKISLDDPDRASVQAHILHSGISCVFFFPRFTFTKVTSDAAGEDGLRIKISLDDPDRASVQLVTELMIMSGEGMARLGREAGFGLPYRCQRPPASQPDEDFFEQFPARYSLHVCAHTTGKL
jgi:hypothetical protein